MKVYQLVAAQVLRVGQGNMRALSWPELAYVFNVTKDVVRHRLNRFKDKYNVVDADVKAGWNREFLSANTPEAEKGELQGLELYPGDYLDTEVGAIVCDTRKRTVYIDSSDEAQIGIASYPYPEVAGKSVVTTVAGPVSGNAETVVPAPATPVVPAPVVEKQQIEPLKSLITPAVLVVIRDGQPLTIDKSHKNFEKIKEALETEEWQAALDFIDMKNTLTKYSNGRVVVEEGRVTLDGEAVSGKVVGRLVNCLLEENKEALDALANFLANCDENPDYRVVTRIYDFMAHNDLRLDKDGYILAYKVVKGDYKDKYTGKMDNSPGQVVKMKRNKVNPKDEETCSHGLHVAAKAYIPQYGSPSAQPGGDKVLLCRIHPKDFVSIPTDYNSMKARVCEYTVLKDVTELFLKRDLDEGVKA